MDFKEFKEMAGTLGAAVGVILTIFALLCFIFIVAEKIVSTQYECITGTLILDNGQNMGECTKGEHYGSGTRFTCMNNTLISTNYNFICDSE